MRKDEGSNGTKIWQQKHLQSQFACATLRRRKTSSREQLELVVRVEVNCDVSLQSSPVDALDGADNGVGRGHTALSDNWIKSCLWLSCSCQWRRRCRGRWRKRMMLHRSAKLLSSPASNLRVALSSQPLVATAARGWSAEVEVEGPDLKDCLKWMKVPSLMRHPLVTVSDGRNHREPKNELLRTTCL